MENFAVTCQLVPGVPHLLSGSCSSPRMFGLNFLQTPPHDDALVLLLSFGSATTWREDSHLASSVPCPAHTVPRNRRFKAFGSRGGWAFPPFRRVLQSFSPVEWASLLVGERHDSNSIRVDRIDQVVGKPPQGLPTHSPSDLLVSLRRCRHLVK